MDAFCLVLNAGSSSLKFCLFRIPDGGSWPVAARGRIEGIGTSPRMSIANERGEKLLDEPLDAAIRDGRSAMEIVSNWLETKSTGGRLVGVGHRVVHGGPRFDEPVVLTREILSELKELTPLAPLHQPHALAPIEVLFERRPEVPQVAVFDTAFHRGRTPVATVVPLPLEYRRGGIERFGFHGISYESIASVLPEIAPDIAAGKVIVAHLGNGASLCAMRNGKSVDTTMGFTALDGLCMGTRPGSIDPGVVLHLFQQLGLSAERVEEILYRQSGLLGISGISNDMRDLLGRNEPEARLAVDYFVHRVVREIGAFAAVLGGVDALVFTAGIGENSSEIRRRVCEASAWLGLELDAAANDRGGPRISTPASRVSTWVIPTNEELTIARRTRERLGL